VVIVQAVLLGFMYLQFTGLSNQVAELQNSMILDQSRLENQTQLQNQTQSMINTLQASVEGVLNDTALPNDGVFAITSAYATGSGPWNVTLIGLNLQKTVMTVTQILVGGTAYTGTAAPYILPLAFQPWTTFHISFILNSVSSGSYSAGMSIPIMLSTSSGSAYSTTVTLPPPDPQQGEKPVVTAYPTAGATPDLVISVTNSGSSTISVAQVQVDGIPVPNAFYSVDVGAAFTGTGPWELGPGATGTFTMYHGEVIGPAPCGMGFIDGMSYPIALVTAAGNVYPSAITWP
jgi:hypothetical protein